MHNRLYFKALLYGVASTLILLQPRPGMAESRSVKVHSFDLDLATEVGQKELKRRIHHGIEQVCGPSGGVTMDEIMSYAACSKAAQANARVQLESLVRAAHDRKLAGEEAADIVIRR